MKKFLSIVLTFTLLVTLVACGSSNSNNSSTSTGQKTIEEAQKIAEEQGYVVFPSEELSLLFSDLEIMPVKAIDINNSDSLIFMTYYEFADEKEVSLLKEDMDTASIEKVTEDYYRLVDGDFILAHMGFGQKHVLYAVPYAENPSDTETIMNLMKDLGFNVE